MSTTLTTAEAERARATAWVEDVHDVITALVERLDQGTRFHEDRWERPGGGGGVTRVLMDGTTFEKGGVNRSAVSGTMPRALAERLGARVPVGVEPRFFATGVSVVIHPRSPRIPTVHLNVRYFQVSDAEGNLVDRWLGGGTDLTPMYPTPDDAAHFHGALRAVSDAVDPSLYPRFKQWCDEYFVNRHRGGEARGVGGVFFDNLREDDESGLSFDALWRYADAIGRVLERAWAPLVERHRHDSWGERERHLQLVRRGRYVEFNLVHDRGTLFGLETAARIESVLMSLPPLAAWDYAPVYEAGSLEADLHEMLRPRDWA